jgi:hypothetical protein
MAFTAIVAVIKWVRLVEISKIKEQNPKTKSTYRYLLSPLDGFGGGSIGIQ